MENTTILPYRSIVHPIRYKVRYGTVIMETHVNVYPIALIRQTPQPNLNSPQQKLKKLKKNMCCAASTTWRSVSKELKHELLPHMTKMIIRMSRWVAKINFGLHIYIQGCIQQCLSCRVSSVTSAITFALDLNFQAHMAVYSQKYCRNITQYVYSITSDVLNYLFHIPYSKVF